VEPNGVLAVQKLEWFLATNRGCNGPGKLTIKLKQVTFLNLKYVVSNFLYY
jgi:hypothetical protein